MPIFTQVKFYRVIKICFTSFQNTYQQRSEAMFYSKLRNIDSPTGHVLYELCPLIVFFLLQAFFSSAEI